MSKRVNITKKSNTNTDTDNSIHKSLQSRPFTTQRVTDFLAPFTQQDVENRQHEQDRMERTKLEIQAKYGVITPLGQEQLTVLQAKKADLWHRYLENRERNSPKFSMKPVHRKVVSPIHAIQPKLTIGAPGDKYEQEADRVAAQVVNQMNAPVAQQENQNLQREEISEEDELTHVVQQGGGEPVVQRTERQTTIYTRSGQQWRRNMQIIDSTDISDYVHVSRSTTTDPQTFANQEIPPNSEVTPNDANKRQLVETATNDNPNFNRDQYYTAENNVHITLEGRYMEVMRTLATNMFDNRDAIKNGPPVVNFANLNFGDFDAHGEQQVSKYGIQQWIEIAAEDTEDFLKTNVDETFADVVPDLIEVVNQVKNSTLNFTNQLIASTPALNQLEGNNKLVHYGGTPWARTQQ